MNKIVDYRAVATDWLRMHAPGATESARASLAAVLVGAHRAGHKEAVREVEALDVEIARQLDAALSGLRTP